MIRIYENKPTWQLWGVVGDPKTAEELADENIVVLCYDGKSASHGNLVVPRNEQGELIWSLLDDCDFVIRQSFGDISG